MLWMPALGLNVTGTKNAPSSQTPKGWTHADWQGLRWTPPWDSGHMRTHSRGKTQVWKEHETWLSLLCFYAWMHKYFPWKLRNICKNPNRDKTWLMVSMWMRPTLWGWMEHISFKQKTASLGFHWVPMRFIKQILLCCRGSHSSFEANPHPLCDWLRNNTQRKTCLGLTYWNRHCFSAVDVPLNQPRTVSIHIHTVFHSIVYKQTRKATMCSGLQRSTLIDCLFLWTCLHGFQIMWQRPPS